MGNFRKDKLTQNDLMYQFTSKPISRIKIVNIPSQKGHLSLLPSQSV